jgi:mono/diheme cytochrome c family protein
MACVKALVRPVTVGTALLIATVFLVAPPVSVRAQQPAKAAVGEVTFTRDIVPILQRSCQNCHRPDSVAPMSLLTYDEVRPYARAIKQRTSIGPHAGVMPPWYMEKNIGIQSFKNDPSLSDEEIAKIGKWVDSGAPQGNPADMPPPKTWADANTWSIGTPDLIVKLPEITVKGNSPDWWGEIPRAQVPLDEDRYVTAVEVKEFNDVDKGGNGRQTVGGRFVFHHLIYSTRMSPDRRDADDPVDATATSWPVHEVGRNADIFGPEAARLLRAHSYIVSDSAHLHSNGRDTKSHLEIGFKLAPKGFQPKYKQASLGLGRGQDIDIDAMEPNGQLHSYAVLKQNTKLLSYEPHLHAPGVRMCLEAIWGSNIETLNCVGYDHNWVRGYTYSDDSAPLLPKGTIVHMIGYVDNSPSNKNVPDPRNWTGSGNRSVTNMFLELGNNVGLTDAQFQDEMMKRRALHPGADHFPGCPLCSVADRVPMQTSDSQQQQQQ